MHCLHEKPVEVKRAVPRDQMAAATAAAAQAAAAATVRAAAAAAAAASASATPLRNCWEPPLSSGNGFHLPASRSSLHPQARLPHDADYFGGGGGGGLTTGPGFAGGSLAAELEALSFHGVGGGGGGEDFYHHRPQSPYGGGGGGGNAPFDRSAFEDATESGATTAAAAAADDSGLVAFLARQQQQHGTASVSAALGFGEKLHHQLHRRHEASAPAPSSTHSLSPPEGSRYRSLYAPSDVFGPPPASTSSASAVAGFSSSEAASSGGEGGGRNSSGEHQRDEERYGRGFEFFPAASASNVPAAVVAPPRSGGTLSPYSDSLGATFGYGDGNGKAGEW